MLKFKHCNLFSCFRTKQETSCSSIFDKRQNKQQFVWIKFKSFVKSELIEKFHSIIAKRTLSSWRCFLHVKRTESAAIWMSQTKKGGIFADKMMAAEFFLNPGEMVHTLYEIANLTWLVLSNTCNPISSLCNKIRDDQVYSIKFGFSRKLNFIRNTYILLLSVFSGKPDLLSKFPLQNLCWQPTILFFQLIALWVLSSDKKLTFSRNAYCFFLWDCYITIIPFLFFMAPAFFRIMHFCNMLVVRVWAAQHTSLAR